MRCKLLVLGSDGNVDAQDKLGDFSAQSFALAVYTIKNEVDMPQLATQSEKCSNQDSGVEKGEPEKPKKRVSQLGRDSGQSYSAHPSIATYI